MDNVLHTAWGDITFIARDYVPDGVILFVPRREVGETDEDFAARIITIKNIATKATSSASSSSAAD